MTLFYAIRNTHPLFVTTLPSSKFTRVRVTWLAYAMLAYYAAMQAALGPLMPFLRAELGLSYRVAGLHLSLFAAGMVISGFIGDGLSHRWGRYAIFWGGGFGMAVGGLILIGGNQALLTLSGSFGMGLGGSLLLLLIQATLADQHGTQRTIALTEANIAASLTATATPLLMGGFESYGLGWRGAILGIVGGLILVYLVSFREPLPTSPQNSHEPLHHPAENRQVSLTQPPLPSRFWAYCVVIGLCVGTEWSIIFWAADFLEQAIGLSKINAASLMSLFFGAVMLGRVIGSYASRFMPSNRLLIITIGIVLVGFPLFWLAPFAWLNVTGLFVLGLGTANLFPLSMSIALSLAPQQVDTASARVVMSAGIAMLTAPFILGWLADTVGIQLAYSIVPLLLLAALAII